MKRLLIALAGILSLTVLPAKAEDRGAIERKVSFFTLLDGENGKWSSAVNTILQDSRGFLWMGTIEGLVWYDGVNTRIYRKNELHTSSSAVSSLYEDRTGNVWIGTEGGLTRFDIKAGDFVPVTSVAGNGVLADEKINSIIEDRNGLIWFSLKGKGICSFDPESAQMSNYLYDPDSGVIPPKIQGMLITPGGDFLLSVYFEGLWRCPADLSSMEPVRLAEPVSFEGDNITSMAFSPSGMLYISSASWGLCEVSLAAGMGRVLVPADNFYPHGICCTPDDRILMATSNGIYNYDLAGGDCSVYNSDNTVGLYGDSFYCITTDNRGGIITGGEFSSVFYSSAGGQFISKYDRLWNGEYLRRSGISGFTGDGGANVWIASHRKGILCLDTKTSSLKPYPFPKGMDICYGICYADGELWAASKESLFRITLATGKVRVYSPDDVGVDSMSDRPVYPIFRERTGRILLGHALGIVEYDPVADSFRSLPGLGEFNVNCIAQESDEIIWFTTYAHGLVRYNFITGELLDYPCQDATWLAANKRLNNVLIDSESRIWVASSENGCLVIFPDGGSRLLNSVNTSGALGSDDICCVREDRFGNIWLSTSNGLTSVSADMSAFARYSEQDGIVSNNFAKRSGYTDPDGTLYFGCLDGFISLSGPAREMPGNNVPGLYISEIKVGNNQESTSLRPYMDFSERIILKHYQNTFSVTFSRPHLPSATDGYILCRLDGLENEWHRTDSKNSVMWRSLPGGRYKLLARSYSGDGTMECNHVPLHVIIRRKPLQSTAARIIYLLFILVAGTWGALRLYRHFLRRATRKQRELIESQIASTPERKLMRCAQLGIPVWTAFVSDLSESDKRFLGKIDAFIDSNMSDSEISYSSVADSLCIGKQSLNKRFKSITGLTVNDYIRFSRLCASVRMLSDEELRINEVCYRVGFNTPSYYAKCFKIAFGLLPLEYREQFALKN